uniref:Dharma n=1 Tax=Echeneis naucrates TaxID=173247 RepID=A0A665VS51_ECHNA
MMDGNRVSDFSIERILSPQLGHKPPGAEFPPDGYLQGIPGGFSLDSLNFRSPVPVPVSVPMPGCLQNFGEVIYPCGPALEYTDHNSPLPGCPGYHHAGVTAQPQSRQKGRARTIFTDYQTRQLEALFRFTDYPAVQARAQVARSTGLSEETVRVWFKNRRARRKRQRSGSKVKSPSPPPVTGAELRVFTSFL